MVTRPSLLSDWTVGHVLAHIAQQGDSITRLFLAAELGDVVDQYEGGFAARVVAIDEAASRSADEHVSDIRRSIYALEGAIASAREGWFGSARMVSGIEVRVTDLPLRRWREVEVHMGDLGLAELGVVSGNDDVAHHRQLATTTQRKTCYRGDHRLAHRAYGLPIASDQVLGVSGDKAVLGQHADVGPCSKCLVAAGDHDAADARIGVESLERGTQLVHQLVVQRVERFRTVQGDQSGAAIAVTAKFGEDIFVGHVGPGLKWCQQSTPKPWIVSALTAPPMPARAARSSSGRPSCPVVGGSGCARAGIAASVRTRSLR